MSISLKSQVREFFTNKDNYNEVFDSCTYLTKDLQSAADLTQDVFLNLVLKEENGSGGTKFPEDAQEFKWYVMKAARNFYFQSLRKKNYTIQESNNGLENLEDLGLHEKDYRAIRRLEKLNQLILKSRTQFTEAQLTLWNCMYECMSIKEMIVVMGKEKQTLYSLRNKLKEKIKSLFTVEMLLD